jgi:hypothetical protein
MAAHRLTAVERGEIVTLLAERWSHRRIAVKFGVRIATIDHYAKQYGAEIATRRQAYDARLIEAGLANRAARLARLSERADEIEAVIAARAADATLAKYPGGSTGLLAEEVVATRSGETRFARFDRALVAEYRGVIDDIAKEMGDRQKRVDVTSGGQTWADLLALATTGVGAVVETDGGDGDADGG